MNWMTGSCAHRKDQEMDSPIFRMSSSLPLTNPNQKNPCQSRLIFRGAGPRGDERDIIGYNIHGKGRKPMRICAKNHLLTAWWIKAYKDSDGRQCFHNIREMCRFLWHIKSQIQFHETSPITTKHIAWYWCFNATTNIESHFIKEVYSYSITLRASGRKRTLPIQLDQGVSVTLNGYQSVGEYAVYLNGLLDQVQAELSKAEPELLAPSGARVPWGGGALGM